MQYNANSSSKMKDHQKSYFNLNATFLLLSFLKCLFHKTNQTITLKFFLILNEFKNDKELIPKKVSKAIPFNIFRGLF